MNKQLGTQIKELRKKKLSYNEIASQLNCSKGTVSYYLGNNQKEKQKARNLLSVDSKKIQTIIKYKYVQELSWRYKRLCGCSQCGIKDPRVLQYDHLDKDNKLLAVSQMIVNKFGLSTIKQEIRKCQILCANCHSIKSHTELGYFSL